MEVLKKIFALPIFATCLWLGWIFYNQVSINDKIEIIYTPNIDDNGISIAWYAKRTNLLKQVKIEPYYIEYKA